MKRMRLMRIQYFDLGDEVELIPSIPQSRLDNEDDETPRICAAITLAQCIYSKFTFANKCVEINGGINFFIYTCDVPIEDIIQPSLNQVDDTWITGELWVIKPRHIPL